MLFFLLISCGPCSVQDWAKPGPYDQPMVNTLKKPKRTPEQAEACRAVSQNDAVPPLRDTRALTASGSDKVSRTHSHAGLRDHMHADVHPHAAMPPAKSSSLL